jgi:hypothetical protein
MFNSTDDTVTRQYRRCITKMAFHDYPAKWPSLLTNIEKLLKSQDSKGWLTGLLSLDSLGKKYRYDAEKETRKELYAIAENFLPFLLTLADYAL